MLDHLLISSSAGHVLFYKDYSSSSSSLAIPHHIKSQINHILHTHIITGALSSTPRRPGISNKSSSSTPASSVVDQGRCFKWVLDSKILVLGIHSVAFSLGYLEKALERIKIEFLSKYCFVDKISGRRAVGGWDEWDFKSINQRDIAQNIQEIMSAFASVSTSNSSGKVPRSFQQTQKFSSSVEGSKVAHQSNDHGKDAITNKVDQLLMNGKGSENPKQPRPFQPKNKGKKENIDSQKGLGKKKKEGRSWDASGAAITVSETPSTLDFSQDNLNDPAHKANTVFDSESLRGSGFITENDGLVMAQDISTLNPESQSQKNTGSSILNNLFSSLSFSSTPLTKQDLEKPLLKIKDHLVGKNVAAPVAAHLVTTLETALLGQVVSKWLGGIDTAIQDELSKSLLKILSPGESINILHQIASKKESPLTNQQVYSICFVGVNGVGKSTNLSKIAFWLLQNGLSVLIAACDTFRSGAVEQLKVHERNLNALCQTGRKVQVFDRGYGKDPAGIAKEALNYAKSEGFDVCLIDTAGRMQDNEPLMRSLAKLVTLNSPDKIVFVGEALVGNEAVDQLTKFNQALQNFSGVAKPRQIDGIVLSKFDTIDDKVGAALSMTFVTGKPVLFVGTGQTYTDLRRMDVPTIVSTLLKKEA